MKINDIVFQNYGGLHRYGKVQEVKENFKGDGWSWAKIDWVDDEKFITSQKWKAEMRNESEDHFIPPVSYTHLRANETRHDLV